MNSFVRRLAPLCAAVLCAVAALPSVAAAHTGLASSTPSESSRVEAPLAEVILVFTGTPTALDDGIIVADSAGTTYEPVSIVQNELEIVATFDPPLGVGDYALAWRVRSDDTHFIDGQLAFKVIAPPATTVAATTVPPTTLPTALPTTVAPAAATPSATSVPPTTVPAAPVPNVDAADGAPPDVAAEEASAETAAPVAVALGDGGEGETVATFGRLLLFPSAVAAIGMLAFAAFAFAGRRAELGTLMRGVRWLGVGVAFGAVIELVGLTSQFGSLGNVLELGAGRAVAARAVAGVLLVVGFASVAGATRPRLSDRARPASSLSAAVADELVDSEGSLSNADDSAGGGRWRPTPIDFIGLAGAAMLVVSFAFDGHTVGSGPRLVHAAASVAHVAGAGIWAGGLVALAVVLWRRSRDGVVSRAIEMIVPFSVIAMASLAVTGFAGVVMAWYVDNDFLGYLSTEWGRLLVIKLAVVGLASLVAVYNHFRVMPALVAAPEDERVIRGARSTITTEAVLLMVAAVLTALLVAASTLG